MTRAAVEPEPSPSWIACSARWDREGDALLRRTHDPADEVFASPLPAILAATTAAGAAGIAPSVVASDSAGFTTELVEGARPAKLDDLADAGLLRAALGLRTRFQSLDLQLPLAQLPERTLFEDVARLREAHSAAGIPPPVEADELSRALDRFAARRERFAMPAIPCHGDGAVSNLLIAPGGASDPKLTGWSVVARRDPLEEAGSVLGEIVPFCATASEVLRALALPVEAELVARAWSVADDLLWGLIASWRMATSSDRAVDYVKYGLWRFTKGRAALYGSPVGAPPACGGLSAWLEDPR
ncbi:MAG: phosphotransferase family protein [Segniliparus sp.]|uniref:phosphotransferase family protein n=1 Tax=Segniliparus sp. TaxID=2804064 RepID=UPI003F388F67